MFYVLNKIPFETPLNYLYLLVIKSMANFDAKWMADL